MEASVAAVSGYAWIAWAIPVILACIFYKTTLRIVGIVIIDKNEVGIANKKFKIFGKNRRLPDGAIIALKGEAGYQADTLTPGLHYWLWPWQYDIERIALTIVEKGKIGIVEAVDGIPLADGRILARKTSCNSFQDARAFLDNGGERGPQIAIIPPGTYRINTRLFKVEMVEMTEVPQNQVGIVTTKEGKPLQTGDIAGPEIAGHNSYQDGQAFLDAGGFKGMQEQVILAGRYYINPKFAKVELKDMTSVPIANAGVVVAYVGGDGQDTTGEGFKHGNLVARGKKGVWNEPYDPGKYPVNPDTHKIELVPTANIVLNWANSKTEAHKLDQNLSTITVRSSDGFKFNLDVSQIIHIPRNDAPKVIARFGTVQAMVTQVLEPTIGNYFRNAAQSSDAIDFLVNRQKRQEEAKAAIANALKEYDVHAVDTLIGDINPPEELMKTLTDRKIAEQEKLTYNTQMEAENVRQQLEQSKAMADTQAQVVASERTVSIAEFQAKAAIAKAEGDAQSKTINAEADAQVLKVVGDATAAKTEAIGNAEAVVIKNKIESMQAGNYAAIEVAKALGSSGQKWVPEVVMAGGNGKSGTIADVLLANIVKDSLGNSKKEKREEIPVPAPAPAAEKTAEPASETKVDEEAVTEETQN